MRECSSQSGALQRAWVRSAISLRAVPPFGMQGSRGIFLPQDESSVEATETARWNVRAAGVYSWSRRGRLWIWIGEFEPAADFFIGRAGADTPFAAEIGRILQDAGHAVVLQQWDFASRNLMERMHAALDSGARVVALLSNDYLASEHCAAEWQNGLALTAPTAPYTTSENAQSWVHKPLQDPIAWIGSKPSELPQLRV